jgi:hypothetical protein
VGPIGFVITLVFALLGPTGEMIPCQDGHWDAAAETCVPDPLP